MGCVSADAAVMPLVIFFVPEPAVGVAEMARVVRPGGTVVCAGIHMSDIPSFPYAWLWGERRIVSVANLTRADGDAFMAVAARLPLRVHATRYALADANRALADLREGPAELLGEI